MLYISSLDTMYYSSEFYFDSGDTDEGNTQIINDLLNASEKTGVDFFAIKYSWNTRSLYTTTIIGTEGAIASLKHDGLSEGDHASLFFPTEKVIYIPIKDCERAADIHELYFIGEENDLEKLHAFKAELVDKYGGGFPKEKGSRIEIIISVLVVWGLILCILLAYAMYEALCIKKENAVKSILGMDLKKLLLRDCISDTFVILTVFIVMRYILTSVSDVRFMERWVLIIILTYVLLNVLTIIRAYSVNYKRDLGNATSASRVLSINYLNKVVITIAVILLVSVNVATMSSAFQLYKQKEFFESHSEYSFYKIGFDLYGEQMVNGEFREEITYREFHKRFQDSAVVYADLTGNYEIYTPFVLINRNAFKELSQQYSQIKAIEDEVWSSNVSVLFPKTVRQNSEIRLKMQEMNTIGLDFNEGEYGKWNEVFYEPGIAVEAFHDDGVHFNLNLFNNPILIVNNTVYNGDVDSTGYDTYYSYDILYKIKEEEWNSFVEENNLDNSRLDVTNALDEFNNRWNQKRRILLLTLALSLFTLFLSVSLIVMIIKTEYHVNATEMALMKIHGYSLLMRNAKLLKTTLISGLIGMTLAGIINLIANLDVHFLTLLSVGGTLVVIELVIILLKAHFVEKRRIYQILKGEVL